jgi:hypothetical protein
MTLRLRLTLKRRWLHHLARLPRLLTNLPPSLPSLPCLLWFPIPLARPIASPTYSATGAWAIRRRYGDKKQILQLRGNEEKAQQVLHKALERLHQGMAEEKVIMWAKKQNI